MSYLALARKYRPRRFGEVATQEHVSETLRSAVAGDRVGHAYLFCGPRGVGKTTMARILAMSLNCGERSEDGEPCGECDNCRSIWGGHTSLDVVEIDAASNRGVDDARELRERAMYAPSQEGRHKVYILDEAHMLTREAWNALLKILEEPPPRVIFCFATTEPRKIRQSASPILSRCQRFDFRRIGADDIVKRLREVLDSEGIGYEGDALRAIGRKANGGMRDGLSLLDQVLALSDEAVTADSVVRVLGVVAEERYLELFDIIAQRRHGAVFDFVEELIDAGHDLVEFYHGLAEKLRLLLRMAVDPESRSGEMGAEMRDAFAQRAAAFAPGDLVRMLAMCSSLETDGSLSRTGRPRVLVEVLLLRMSYLDRTVELEDVIKALGGAPAREAPAATAPAPPATAPPPPAPRPPRPPTRPQPPSRPSPPPPAPKPRASQPRPAPPPPAPPPPSPSTPAPPRRDLTAAWAALLADNDRVERRLRLLLRGAAAREKDGSLVLEVPADFAADIANPAALRKLEAGLAVHAGRKSAKISVVADGAGKGAPDGPVRIDPNTAREMRMRELVASAPHLEHAVRALDLELVD